MKYALKKNAIKEFGSNTIFNLDMSTGEVLFTLADLNKSKTLIGVPEFMKWYKNNWIQSRYYCIK